jgi:hypothetical protein
VQRRCLLVTTSVGVVALAAAPLDAQVFLPFVFRLANEIVLQVGDRVGTQPIAVADVNHDGRADLVAIMQDDDQVAVLLRTGSAEFGPPLVFPLDVEPTAIAVADVGSDTSDGSAAPDGNADLIVASDEGVPVLLIGDGEGGFSDADEQDLGELVEGVVLVGVAVADFAVNGQSDLAFLDGQNQVFFLCNDQGQFSACATATVQTNGTSPVDIAAGDFDGDAFADVAVLNRESRNVSVIYGAGNGTFTADPRTLGAAVVDTNEPQALATTRIDSGTTDDIVVVNFEDFDSLGVLALYGLRRNQFQSEGFTVGFFSTDIALGDLDDDGAIDAVMSLDDPDGGSGPTLLAGVQGSFDQNLFGAPGAERMGAGRAVVLGDVGGDSLPDIVQLQADGESIRIAINASGEPRPTATPTFTSPPPPTATPIASPTLSATPVALGADDDGCGISQRSGRPAIEVGILGGLLLLARRRRRNTARRALHLNSLFTQLPVARATMVRTAHPTVSRTWGGGRVRCAHQGGERLPI